MRLRHGQHGTFQGSDSVAGRTWVTRARSRSTSTHRLSEISCANPSTPWTKPSASFNGLAVIKTSTTSAWASTLTMLSERYDTFTLGDLLPANASSNRCITWPRNHQVSVRLTQTSATSRPARGCVNPFTRTPRAPSESVDDLVDEEAAAYVQQEELLGCTGATGQHSVHSVAREVEHHTSLRVSAGVWLPSETTSTRFLPITSEAGRPMSSSTREFQTFTLRSRSTPNTEICAVSIKVRMSSPNPATLVRTGCSSSRPLPTPQPPSPNHAIWPSPTGGGSGRKSALLILRLEQ